MHGARGHSKPPNYTSVFAEITLVGSKQSKYFGKNITQA
jgi:hypothetical protein